MGSVTINRLIAVGLLLYAGIGINIFMVQVQPGIGPEGERQGAPHLAPIVNTILFTIFLVVWPILFSIRQYYGLKARKGRS